MPAPIVLLTDFGLTDPYVGQLKGSILNRAPQATIIDLCHDIRAHDVTQAGFLLQASHAHFPAGSIFVAVVDPGVGTNRALLLAHAHGRLFLAPDNGLLSFLAGADVSWWRINANPIPDSRTFHGRDILAPLAARLALGAAPKSLGHPVDPADIVRLPQTRATVHDKGLDCLVLHVDRFGNCLLNLPIEAMPADSATWALDNGRTVSLVRTYADLPPGQVGLLAGSQEVMELAVNGGSCARVLGLAPGSAVRLIRTGSD